jgi:hypothetical protein
MKFRRVARGATVLCGAMLAFGLGRATARGKADATIVGVCGVGCVLSESGAIWQFHPKAKRWMTIDEAFRQDGREVHALPLPVPVKSIRFMQSWGFLVTTEGKAWLYDQDESKWVEIGTP